MRCGTSFWIRRSSPKIPRHPPFFPKRNWTRWRKMWETPLLLNQSMKTKKAKREMKPWMMMKMKNKSILTKNQMNKSSTTTWTLFLLRLCTSCTKLAIQLFFMGEKSYRQWAFNYKFKMANIRSHHFRNLLWTGALQP